MCGAIFRVRIKSCLLEQTKGLTKGTKYSSKFEDKTKHKKEMKS